MQYRRAPPSNYDRNGKLVRSKLPTDAAPPPIFQRTLAWRNKKNAKIRAARQQQAELREQQQEGGGGGGIMSAGMSAGMDFHAQYKEATVGEHIDAFHRYNMLVGEADGGDPLPEAEYRKLEKRCAEAAKDRLFCTWPERRDRHGLRERGTDDALLLRAQLPRTRVLPEPEQKGALPGTWL